MEQTISACLVVYNEEKIIQRCLESLKGVVDEIVVVHDGPCKDRTLDICKLYTDKIFIRDRIGVAEPHRPFSFQVATGDWVLLIDADEVLSPNLHENLRGLVKCDDVDLYCLVWPYTDGDRLFTKIQHPYRACLARRSKMYFYGIPEEPLRTYGNVKKVPFVLEHRPKYNNYTWHKFRSKNLVWFRILAKMIWMSPQEIPCYGVNDKISLVRRLQGYRRNPLLKTFTNFFFHLAWQLYKGLWKIGIVGLKIAFMRSVFKACIYYYTFKYKPKKGG